MSALDELRHLPIEKSEQQCTNVRPINVRIGHDYDAVIAQLVDIEIIASDAATKRCDQRAHLD